MTRLLTIALLLIATACTAVPTPPASPTAVRVTVTVSTATLIPTITLTSTAAPVVTITATPEPGGYRMRTVRPIPVGVVDVMAWVCHDENYWWDVTAHGMTLHEDVVGERLCLGVKTL